MGFEIGGKLGGQTQAKVTVSGFEPPERGDLRTWTRFGVNVAIAAPQLEILQLTLYANVAVPGLNL
jgi:hypothetical protein